MNAILKTFVFLAILIVGISTLSLVVDLQGKNRQLEESLSENQKLRALVEALNIKNSDNQAEIQRLKARIRELEQQNKLLSEQNAVLEKETERLLSYVSGLQRENGRLDRELVALRDTPQEPAPKAGQEVKIGPYTFADLSVDPFLPVALILGLVTFGLPTLGFGIYRLVS